MAQILSTRPTGEDISLLVYSTVILTGRSYRAKYHGLPFPKIPSTNTILNLNHTLFPTFYGCYEEDVPLVL